MSKYFWLSVIHGITGPVPATAGTTVREFIFLVPFMHLLFVRMSGQSLAEVDFEVKFYFFSFITDALT